MRARFRKRYDRSRANLIRLLPHLMELRVFDNSVEADPGSEAAPTPLLALHMASGNVAAMCDLRSLPEWAKPIAAAAMNLRDARL
jgi:hypothetical protein